MHKNDNHIVKVNFLSGYTARQVMTLVDNIVGAVPIFFYKDWFEIKHAKILDQATGKKIVVNFLPRMRYIVNYKTCPEYFSKNSVHVSTPVVRDFTRFILSTTKKDGLELSCYKNEPESLYVTSIKSGSSGVGNSKFKNVIYKLFDIRHKEDTMELTPNIKVPLNDISLLCSNINKSRSQYREVVFKGYKNGLSIGVKSHTDVAHISDCWGECEEKDLIGVYKLNLEINKALAGVHNITESGVVPMYFTSNVLKLILPIGCYGETLIILENGYQEQTEIVEEPEKEDSSDESSQGYWSN